MEFTTEQIQIWNLLKDLNYQQFQCLIGEDYENDNSKEFINSNSELKDLEVRKEASFRSGRDFDEMVEVYYLPKYDLYLQFTGYYSSYEGTDFRGVTPILVIPKQVMKTIYEKIDI